MMNPKARQGLHGVKCHNKVGAERSLYHIFVARGCTPWSEMSKQSMSRKIIVPYICCEGLYPMQYNACSWIDEHDKSLIWHSWSKYERSPATMCWTKYEISIFHSSYAQSNAKLLSSLCWGMATEIRWSQYFTLETLLSVLWRCTTLPDDAIALSIKKFLSFCFLWRYYLAGTPEETSPMIIMLASAW